MASSKVMASSNPRNSDLAATTAATTTSPTVSTTSRSRRPSNPSSAKHHNNDTNISSPSSTMTVDGILRNVYAVPSSESTLLDAQITLIDNPLPPHHPIETTNTDDQGSSHADPEGTKTVDEVWREIVAGRKEMKEEPDEMMTLEDFLAKAGAVDVEDDDEVKMPQSERLSGGVYAFDAVLPQSTFQMLDKVEGAIVGFGNGVEVVTGNSGGGRGKRGRAALLEPLDKASQQRQRRMIKNRESAARSRERKQAYQVELESLAVRLEEENEQLLKEKEERTRERFKQLMENVVPIVEKQQPRRVLRRVNSSLW